MGTANEWGETLFSRVVLVLDKAAVPKQASCHAQEWAERLSVPLATAALDASASGRAIKEVGTSAREGRFVEPGDLLVLGPALAPKSKRAILQQSSLYPEVGILACSVRWSPLSRMLVVDLGGQSADRFLAMAVHLCSSLSLSAVVLTLGRSMRAAQRRQEVVRRLVEGCGVSADLDVLVGAELRTAIQGVARWRRCSVVCAEREEAPSWWRWLRGGTMEQLFGLSDAFSFLALPVVTPASHMGVLEKHDLVR